MVEGDYDYGFGFFSAILSTVADIIDYNLKVRINNMLEVRNLHATIAGKEILKGINLTIKDGEVHAIMGP